MTRRRSTTVVITILLSWGGVSSCVGAIPQQQARAASGGQSMEVPVIVATGDGILPGGTPDELQRRSGVVNTTVLRDDLPPAGLRIALRLFGPNLSYGTIHSSMPFADGRTLTGQLDEGGDILIQMSGPHFTAFIQRPGVGDVEVASCADNTCVVRHFRPILPLQCQVRGVEGPERKPIVSNDGLRIVDILVLYTDDVVTHWSAWNDPRVARNDIAGWVQVTNRSLTCSGVHIQLRLVHTAVVSFKESGSFETDLKRWTNPADVDAGKVLTGWRNEVGADLVSVIEHRSDNKDDGYANLYRPTALFRETAVNIVRDEAALCRRVFSHELGHNLGGGHDDNDNTGYRPYSRGALWFDGSTQMATVMVNAVAQRTDIYSNPDRCYNDYPTGECGLTDNARTLNETASKVASFRPSKSSSSVQPVQCTHDTSCTNAPACQ